MSEIINKKIDVKDILNLALYAPEPLKSNDNEKEIAKLIAEKLIFNKLYYRLFMDYFYQVDKDKFLHTYISSINYVNTQEEDFDDFFFESLKIFVLYNLKDIIDNEEIEDIINIKIDVVYDDKSPSISYLELIDFERSEKTI